MGGTETILVAEDEEHVRMLIKTLLTEVGYTVLEAENGAEAVALARPESGPIQLLLADVIMPRKNGKEAYEEIVALRPDIKCIFMSGYSDDIIDDRLIASGIDLITKPLLPGNLLRRIREVLDRP